MRDLQKFVYTEDYGALARDNVAKLRRGLNVRVGCKGEGVGRARVRSLREEQAAVDYTI